MDLTAINRTPIGAAARGVGRATYSAVYGVQQMSSFVFGGRSSSYGWRVFLNRTRIDYSTAINDPFGNSIVVAVVGWIARTFPEAPVEITREAPGGGGRERVARSVAGPGAMLRLLERPNRYYSGVLMMMAVVVDLYCTGNAYIVKVRNGSGRVVELWPIPKRFIRPDWPDDGSVFISRYIYTVDGVEYEIPEADVIHIRDGIDPNNPRLGLSKLASLLREIYTDDEAANFSAALLTNLGVPGVVIAPSNTGGAVGKTDPEGVKTAFMEKFGGDRRGEPLVLTAPTDVKVLSFSPEQMNLKELRRVPEERVSGVLGVSAIVAGLGAGLDRSTFTNFGEARKAAYEESVIPLQRLMSAEFDVQLLPEFASEQQIEREGLDTGFDLRNVRALQEAAADVWRRTESAATRGLLTRATFKRAIGEAPAPDGSDDVYVIPNNFTVLPVGGASAPPAGSRPQLVDSAAAQKLLTSSAEATVMDPVRCSKGHIVAGRLAPPSSDAPTVSIKCHSCRELVEVAA